MGKFSFSRLSKDQLAGAYLLTCLIYLYLAYRWIGYLFLWLSIFTFGLPLLLFLLPLIGLRMFSLKSERSIFLSFISSLTPMLYLLPGTLYFPFEVQTTAAGHTSQIPVALSWAIIASAVLFLGTSILSFRYCLKAYNAPIE